MKAILIDDEPLSRELLRTYLKAFPEVEVIEECGDGFEGVKAIQQHKPDVIFLDIQMPKISGFEMLELLDESPSVIFVTAFDEYAIKAFETNAVDYLLKPFSEERLQKAMQKLADKSSEGNVSKLVDGMAMSPYQSNRIVVKTGQKIKIIQHHEVKYMEADDDYVRIVTAEGPFLKNKTMSFYEQTLDPTQFIRVHRSYIVNISQITRIDPFQKETHLAVLREGKQIPVSKTGYTKLKEIFGL
jgi:two-component system LytT family response regulator